MEDLQYVCADEPSARSDKEMIYDIHHSCRAASHYVNVDAASVTMPE
jgi:hypothetical protein